MKKILSIVLLLVTILLFSCKKEDILGGKENTIKKVKSLTYSFSNNLGEKDNTTKSHTSEKAGVIPINKTLSKKVLATELLEIGGEFFTATLVEESEPVLTKATQTVNGSDVYTFYKYENSIIREQPGIVPGGQFFVPSDDASDYGIIFLSSAIGNGNPDGFTTTKPALDKENKKITYTANLNDNLNLCYSIFDKKSLQGTNDLAVNFTPVFSQIGLSVPATFAGKTITVDEFSLISGIQETANVVVTYDSKTNPKIRVDYTEDKTTVFTKKLECVTNGTIICLKDNYYNIIPNGNKAIVKIKMTVDGVSKVHEARLTLGELERGKRYNLIIDNRVFDVLPNGRLIDIGNNLQLKAILVNSKGDTTNINDVSWLSLNTEIATVNESGLVTAVKDGIAKIEATYTDIHNNIIKDIALVYVNIAPPVIFNGSVLDYYQWDAQSPYYLKDENEGFGAGLSGCNPLISGSPRYSCKGLPTIEEMKVYLGNGVYYDEGEEGPNQQTYTIDGETYHAGLWLKRKKTTPNSFNYSAKKYFKLTSEDNPDLFKLGRPSDIREWFFLPACGTYSSGKPISLGTSGYYWLKEYYSYKGDNQFAMSFHFGISFAMTDFVGLVNGTPYFGASFRKHGKVPLVVH